MPFDAVDGRIAARLPENSQEEMLRIRSREPILVHALLDRLQNGKASVEGLGGKERGARDGSSLRSPRNFQQALLRSQSFSKRCAKRWSVADTVLKARFNSPARSSEKMCEKCENGVQSGV
jgi:hypothetical protein